MSVIFYGSFHKIFYDKKISLWVVKLKAHDLNVQVILFHAQLFFHQKVQILNCMLCETIAIIIGT